MPFLSRGWTGGGDDRETAEVAPPDPRRSDGLGTRARRKLLMEDVAAADRRCRTMRHDEEAARLTIWAE